jgi:hypothetical protein
METPGNYSIREGAIMERETARNPNQHQVQIMGGLRNVG